MKKEKITIKVLIENDKMFEEDFQENQKIKVIINKVLAKLGIDEKGRVLKNEDGVPFEDLMQTIEEANLTDGVCLRFFKEATKPDRDKGFA